MQQVESASTPIPEIQIPVQNRFIKNFLKAMAGNLARDSAPGVIIVPKKDRCELRSAMALLTKFIDEDAEPVFIHNDPDLIEYVFDESHHRPVVHLNAENISFDIQEEATQFWSQASVLRPSLMIFVVSRDPGEIQQEGVWLMPFRRMMHMPTFRWPASESRLKTPQHRLGFFLEVFQQVASKQLSGETQVDPGAKDFLLETLFTQHAPRYTGNYVKLAADAIATMRKFGEEKLTTKVVVTTFSPDSQFALT